MLIPVHERSFIKDIKRAQKRQHDLQKLAVIVNLLLEEKPLPAKNYDHKLKGNYIGCRECHIEPNWLLIYRKTPTEIIFVRTGTHADLF